MTERLVFATTDDLLTESMEQASHAGASALGAVLWAYMAAVGAEPGVLLSPLSILLSGFGARRAFDGRCRQPGLGLKRPRGFLSAGDVPDTARVAASQTLAAWFVALTYDEKSIRSMAFAAAQQRAKQSGSAERGALLAKIARHGVTALRQDAVRKELLGAVGPVAGGNLSVDDLSGARDVDQAASRSGEAWSLPWDAEGSDFQGRYQCVLAHDRRGTIAALVYAVASKGVAIPALGLLAPLEARPVMRGLTRPRSGVQLPFAPAIRLTEPTEQRAVSLRVRAGQETLLELHH